jgi:hypothetical protein
MHPYLVSLLAAEHVCDLRAQAAADRHASWTRRSRRGTTSSGRPPSAGRPAPCSDMTIKAA